VRLLRCHSRDLNPQLYFQNTGLIGVSSDLFILQTINMNQVSFIHSLINLRSQINLNPKFDDVILNLFKFEPNAPLFKVDKTLQIYI